MVEWSDSERNTIASVWGKINVGEIGPQALARLLISLDSEVYRFLWKPIQCGCNPGQSQAVKPWENCAKCVKNLDGIKGTYS